MSTLLPPTILEDLFGARGPDERQRVLLEEIEEALKSRSRSGVDAADDDAERIPLAALAAARVAALDEEDTSILSSPRQQLLLLEPLALGVRLEAGAVARLLEVCRRRRRRRWRRRKRRGEEGEEEEVPLLLLERAAVAASSRLAPPFAAAEEAEEEAEASEGPPSPSSSPLVRWSTENGASVSFEAKSWRRTRTRATATTATTPTTTATTTAAEKGRGGREDSTDSSFLLRGAAATRSIAPGQEIARIPIDHLIHARMLASTDAGRAICSLKLPDEEALLAFTLLDAADEDSPRAPVWDSLRRGTASSLRTALNATEAELALLDARTPARRLAGHVAEHAGSAARAAAPLLLSLRRAFGPRVRAELFPGVGSFSEEAYRWAMAVWYAYAIELDIDGDGGGGGGEEGDEEGKRRGGAATVPCLAPPLFLLNHSPHPHCVSYRLEEGSFEEEEEGGGDEGGKEEGREGAEDEEEEEVGATNTKRRRFLVARACRSAEGGQQLFLSYGRLLSKSAAHSLCFYGFVVDGGADPDAALEVDLLDALEGGSEGAGASAPREAGAGQGRGGAGRGAGQRGERATSPPPPGLETRHFLRATGALSPAVLSAAKEVAAAAHLAAAAGGGGDQGGRRPLPLSPGEVLRRAALAAARALAATAERAEGAIRDSSSSSPATPASPFTHAILEYARSGVELADRVVASGALLGTE